MKISITDFFQFIFRYLMIFMLIFVWVRYNSDNLYFSIYLSAFIALIIEIGFKILKQKRIKKLGLKQEELEIAQNTINKLIFNTQTENVNLFYKILQKQELVTKHKEYLIITNKEEELIALFPAFTYSNFSVDSLAKCFQKVKKHNLKKLIICTRATTKEANELAKKANFEVLILQMQEVYARLFKKYDYKPNKTELFKIENVSKEIKFKDIAKNAITPNKTKKYFFSSVILLLASYFVPYKLYYYIFASFLLILSIASFTSLWWKKQVYKNLF